MTNAALVRSFYEAIEGGDLEGGLALLAPDCVWKEMDGFPYRGTYRGPDEVREHVFFRIGGEWEGFTMTVDEVLDAGDSVVGVGTYSGTFKATGKAMQARVVHVFRLRDGKIVGFEQFADTLRVSEALP
jgi:ketosteroid isomerase-like protein